MTSPAELTLARWQRRYSDRVYRLWLFAEFSVGGMLPGTMVYQRLALAIALQQAVHACRAELRRLERRLR